MIILVFVISAAVTGGLLALLARTQGIQHDGILFAIGVMGAGIQMVIILGAYLHHTSAKRVRQQLESLPEMKEPNAERISGR